MPDRAVVFDLYGTLVDEPTLAESARLVQDIADALGVGGEPFAQAWHDSYDARATGALEPSIRGILRSLGALWDDGRYGTARKLRNAFVARELVPRPDAEETLDELRRRGYRLGLMTECGDAVPELWPKTAIAHHFAAAVYTCEVGKRKPDPALYELIVRRLDVAPEHCTYVGDGGGHELAGAARAGMRPVLLVAPYSEWLHPEAQEWRGEQVGSLGDLLRLL